MNLTYAIGDMHGRADLYYMARQAIREHDLRHPVGDRTLVVTGDFVDRGMRSAELIRMLRKQPPPGWKKVILQGNHEDMMLQACMNPTPRNDAWWGGNGGLATRRSFGGNVPEDVLKWVANLPVYYEDEHRFFVHAGVDLDKPLEQQDRKEMMWMLWPEGSSTGYRGKHIVHGHEQDRDNPRTWGQRTDIDSFAWHTGRLAIAVFDDDKPCGPIEILEVKGANYRDHVLEWELYNAR